MIQQSTTYPLQFVAGLNPANINNVFDYLHAQSYTDTKAREVLKSLVEFLTLQKKPVSSAPQDKNLANIVYEIYYFLLVGNNPSAWHIYRAETNWNGGYMAGAYWCPYTWGRDLRARLAAAYLRSQYFQLLPPESRIWASLTDFYQHGGG